MRRIQHVLPFFTILILTLLIACRREQKTLVETVSICIPEAPEALFPYHSKSTIAGQINSKIYLPLADFNPQTLQLEPVLLEELPEAKQDSMGERYTFHIEKEARWSDGKPVTAGDVVFTLKLIANPYAGYGSVRSTLSNIIDVSTADISSTEFSVVFNGAYHLDLEAFTNLPVLPAHILDPGNDLGRYDWPVLMMKGDSLTTVSDSTALQGAVRRAEAVDKDFTGIIGSGPYRVAEWIPGQRLSLSRIDSYWGADLAKRRTELQAKPSKINYLIIPEESTALAALKSGQVDLLPDVKETTIDQIKNDPNLASHFKVLSADVLQYYYIGMNNNGRLLSDVRVRSALAHLVNVDQMIETLLGGNANKVISPILPQKPYYVGNLKSPDHNPSKAAAILDQAGYNVRGNDGIRVKNINGKSERLSLTILTTGKQLGKDVATLLKNEAAKIGVEIRIEILDFPKILERIRAGNYDMANLVVKQFPGLDDPYLAWNSSNAFGKGSNYCNFSNPAIDRITDEIRSAGSSKERDKLYRDFQRKIVEQYPAIFLFSPKNQLVIREGREILTSAKRPGYFENTMQ